MLATLPRAAPRAARRITTSTSLRSPLSPSYNHSVRPALSPPYNHPLAHVPEGERLKAPYAFSLIREQPKEPAGPTPTEWVESLIQTKEGRQWVEDTFAATLKELSEQVSFASKRCPGYGDRPGLNRSRSKKSFFSFSVGSDAEKSSHHMPIAFRRRASPSQPYECMC